MFFFNRIHYIRKKRLSQEFLTFTRCPECRICGFSGRFFWYFPQENGITFVQDIQVSRPGLSEIPMV